MRRLFQLPITILFLCLTLIGSSGFAQSDQILEALESEPSTFVRVYFNDIALGRTIASTFEPYKTKYDEGYVILIINKEDYLKLRPIATDRNLRLEWDAELVDKHSKKMTFRSARQLSFDSQLNAPLNMTNAYPSISSFSCYRTVEGTYQTAEDIVTNYPTLATWSDVGDSWEKENGLGGYDQMVLRLTNSQITGSKPKIFVTSSIHAREYTTAELMTRFAEHLVQNYGVDADVTWVLDYHELHFMLVANPDGRKFAEQGILWRKNTNQNYCGPNSNSRGADLNRNFPFEWNCCGGSSIDPCSNTFHGAFEASEPEVQGVVNYLNALFPDSRGPNANDAAPLDTQGMYLDIHSSGRLMLWPWGTTSDPAPNGTQLQTLGRKLAFYNGHTPQQSIGLYPTNGTTNSYSYGELGLPSLTFELGTEFFESCDYFENTLIQDNFPSLMYAVKTLRAPYQLPSGPEVFNVNVSPASSQGVPAGTTVTLTAQIDDSRYNNSNGTEPSQTISQARYYLDNPSWVSQPAIPVNMISVDGSFNESFEEVSAEIDTTGWSEGQHIIYVEGQDSQGNNGVVSAVFITINNSAQLPTTVFFDDFETDLGWQLNPNNTDQATTGRWERANPEESVSGNQQLGTPVSGNFDLVTGSTAGSSVGVNDIDNGLTSIRSPQITLPSNATNLNLNFHYYLAHFNNATVDDLFRVYIIDGANQDLIYEELGDANQDNAAWQQQTLSLQSYAGKVIRLQFEAADNASPTLVEAAVDDVEIIGTLPPIGNQAPNVDAGSNQTIQLPATALLTGVFSDDGLPSGSSLNFVWNDQANSGNVTFVDGASANTEVSFATAGTYTLTLTASDGELTASDSMTVIVEPTNVAPVSVIDVSATSGSVPLLVNFSGSGSNDTDGVIVSYAWEFGDGSSSTLTNPNHTYMSEGNYSANLTVTDDDGVASTQSVTISVLPPPNQDPIANFSSTLIVGDIPYNYDFDASASSDADGSIINYSWDFGDGSQGLGEQVNHVYAGGGSYTVILTVTDNDGAENSLSKVIATAEQNLAPTANISVDSSSGVSPLTINFNGENSNDTDGTIVSYEWDFGDGATGSGITVNHTFNTPGLYSVTLTVDDNDGATATASLLITVNVPNIAPQIDAGVDQTSDIGNDITLVATVSDDGLPANSVSTMWSQLSGPDNVVFTDVTALTTLASFSSAGVYNLRITANDGELSANDDIQVTIEEPIAGCPAGSIDFNQFGFESYSNQDASGGTSVLNDGSEIRLTGNSWKRSLQNYQITPNTVIEFEYASTGQGEIHGIGFDEDQTLTNNLRLFRFWGTQNWSGAINYTPKYTGNGDFQEFSIPVGTYFSESNMRLVLMNDNDAGATANDGTYRCVRIREEEVVACPIEEDFENGFAGWSTVGSSCATGTFTVAIPSGQTSGGVMTQVQGDRTSGVGNALFTATNTSAGANDVDRGECVVESPMYSVSQASELSIWYFHGQRDSNDDANGDYFNLDYSIDGGVTWSSMASNGDAVSIASWTKAVANIPSNSQIKLRARVSDGIGAGDIIEAGLDAMKICPIP